MKLTEAEKQKRREYYQKNKQKFIDKAKAWKAKNPEKARESVKKSVAKARSLESREDKKEKHLLQKYGISLEVYSKMYHEQHGQCKICRTPLDFQNVGRGSGTANVDHCHFSGKVRGLLCNNCNRGLGHLKDSPTLLRLAAEYLDAFNK